MIESIPDAIFDALRRDRATVPAESPEVTALFDAWMAEVDALLCDRYGVTTDDLPDARYRDWFDAGVRPRAAVARLARSVG